MATSHTRPRSNGQFSKRDGRSEISYARVRLLPLDEAVIPPMAATSMQGKTTEQRRKYAPFFAGWILLPMRLFLGVTFVYAGIQKLIDPQFFHASTPGYIGRQLAAFAQGSPLHDLLLQVAVPHALLFGYAIAFGEIAIGLGTLCGLLFRPAAFFGLMLSLLFFLSASWLVHPYFYGADIVFVFCWLIMLLHGPVATGYPTLDSWLMRMLFPQHRSGVTSFARALLIGSPERPEGVMLASENSSITDVRTSLWQGDPQESMRGSAQRRREARRNFLLGTITGVSGVVGLGIIGVVMNALLSGGESTASQATVQSPGTPITSGTSGGSSNVIAQVSAVARNAATTFTIPSTHHPGVLIHLPSDQFVAYDAICTHAGCRVDYDPTSQHLVCPCHGAIYDPAQEAAVLSGPTHIPLTVVSIQVDSATGGITLKS